MKVVVPSLGRAGTSSSMEWLRDCGRDVMVAVHEDESAAYRKAYPWAEVMVLPETCRRHVGMVRQEIMRREKRPMFFVDDDVYVRLVKFKSYAQMFDQLEKHLTKVPMAGIGKQIFSQSLVAAAKPYNGDKMVVHNKFVSLVYGVVPSEFRECPLDQFRVYEDCVMIIHAIRRGGTIVSFSATHTNRTPPQGGCNSWRTPEVVLDSLERLVDLYPDVCRKVDTRHTAHGHALGVGVRVAWSRIRSER